MHCRLRVVISCDDVESIEVCDDNNISLQSLCVSFGLFIKYISFLCVNGVGARYECTIPILDVHAAPHSTYIVVCHGQCQDIQLKTTKCSIGICNNCGHGHLHQKGSQSKGL